MYYLRAKLKNSANQDIGPLLSTIFSFFNPKNVVSIENAEISLKYFFEKALPEALLAEINKFDVIEREVLAEGESEHTYTKNNCESSDVDFNSEDASKEQEESKESFESETNTDGADEVEEFDVFEELPEIPEIPALSEVSEETSKTVTSSKKVTVIENLISEMDFPEDAPRVALNCMPEIEYFEKVLGSVDKNAPISSRVKYILTAMGLSGEDLDAQNDFIEFVTSALRIKNMDLATIIIKADIDARHIMNVRTKFSEFINKFTSYFVPNTKIRMMEFLRNLQAVIVAYHEISVF